MIQFKFQLNVIKMPLQILRYKEISMCRLGLHPKPGLQCLRIPISYHQHARSYIWSENSSPKSEVSFVLSVNRADKNNKKGLELTSNSAFNFRHLAKECAEIFDFDINLLE